MFCLALPDSHDVPTRPTKSTSASHIACNVLIELVDPEIGPRLWCRAVGASAMSMPETAVNEDHKTMARKNQIRASGKVLAVQPKPEPEAMQQAADNQFWLCVTRSDPRHHATATLGTDDVHWRYVAMDSQPVRLYEAVKQPQGRVVRCANEERAIE
jgi:hypothetical protein